MQTVAVLGAGTMGHGIAQVLAFSGHPVRLFDPDPRMLASAPDRIRSCLETFRHAGLCEAGEAEDCMGRISLHASQAEACRGAGLVVEAAPEQLDLKRRIFAAVEEAVSPDTLLCTNTSAFSITELGSGLKRPERFLGTHFWNPPQVIPCVEVIPGPSTDPAAVDKVIALLSKAGKEPVRLGWDLPGFLGNRLQHALQREALSLVQSGAASVEDVDRVVRYGFGLRLALIGPIERADLAGLDTTLAVQRYLLPKLENRTTPSPLLERLVRERRLGAKSGAGFFDWPEEKRLKRAARRDRGLLAIIKLMKELDENEKE